MAEANDSFDLAVYLLASARLALDEPLIYASFRLLEGASRAIGPDAGQEEYLRGLRQEIESEKLRMIDDPAGYASWLDELLRRAAAEAKRLNRADGLE